MRRARRFAVVCVAAAAVAACSSGPQEPGPHDFDAFDTKPVATITVDEDGFDPATTTVRAGDVIDVVNGGDEPHRVIAGDVVDTGSIEPGDSVAVVLQDEGTVRFADQATPSHRSTITVQPAPPAG